MQIHDLSPAEGSTHRRKIVGRGPGSGHGKNSTRGAKGHGHRGQINPNFEGGQTPLHRRLPQLRGFKPINKIQYALVNMGQLEEFEAGTEVTPEVLVERGILRAADTYVKILGDGELTHSLTVRAHKFSKSAIAKVQAAGGTVETL